MKSVSYDKTQAEKEGLFQVIQQLNIDITQAGNPPEGTLGSNIQKKRIARLLEMQEKYNSL